MKMKHFIEKFGTDSCIGSSIPNPDEEIYTYKPFCRESAFEPHILYVGCYSELPAAERESHLFLNFLCALTTEDEFLCGIHKKRYPHANFIFAVMPQPAHLIYDAAASIFLAENRFISQINHLSAAAASNRGLQYLIDEACRLCRSPIIVTDISGQVLAMYRDFLSDEAYGADISQLNDIIDYNQNRLRCDNIYEQLRQSETKLHCGAASDSGRCWIDTLVYVQEIEAAEISVMEFSHPFDSYDLKFVQFLTQAVSCEIQKRHSASVRRRQLQSAFLSDLLDEKLKNPHPGDLLPEGREPQYLYLLLIFSMDQTKTKNNILQKAEIFSMQMQSLLPDSHWVIREDHIVFLIFKDHSRLDDFRPDSPLSDILSKNKMYGILSLCFSDLQSVQKYYRLTLSVKEFKSCFAPDMPVSFYSDFYIYHIGRIISENYDLRDFYHPLVRAIQKYDESNHTNYLDTLEEYLTHIDNPSLSAQNLCIHRNTFFYRINKLKELFPVNLKNGIERMKLLLTIEFMRLEK